MKFFKNVRTFLASMLCATMCVTGGIAISSLNGGNVKAADGSTPTVSSDIQYVLDAFNSYGSGNFFTAEHVTGEKIGGSESLTTSGIKVTAKYNKDKAYEYNILKFNASSLDYNEPMVGVVFDPETQGTNTLGQPYFYFSNMENDTGWSYCFSVLEEDSASKPSAGVNIRFISPVSKKFGSRIGVYGIDNQGKVTESDSMRPASLKGYTATPFNMYYDYKTNVTYTDINSAIDYVDGSGVDTGTVKNRFTAMLGVKRTEYANYATTFVNPYATEESANPLTLKNGAQTSTFAGFEDGKVTLGFRKTAENAGGSFILTSIAGLDLTNPTNTFGEDSKVLVAEDKVVKAGNDFEIGAPKYQTPFGGALTSSFEGKVNVYKGTRTYKYSYSAYGATYNSITADPGITTDPVATDKSVGDKITFTDIGTYTVEYIDGDYVAYSEVVVPEAVALTTDLKNVTLKINGNDYVEGDTIIIGDKVTVVPNEGYTIWGMDNITDNVKKIKVNNNYKTLESDGSYTIQASDATSSTISLTALAYSKRYTVSLIRHNNSYSTYSDALSAAVKLHLFEGIPSTYYSYYDSKAWKNGKFYSLISYDGMGNTWTNDADRTGILAEDVMWASNRPVGAPDKGKYVGYAVKNSDTGEDLGLFKTGTEKGVNSFEVNCNISLEAIYLVTRIETATIKTGDVNSMSVKFKMNESAYNKIIEALGDKANTATINAVVADSSAGMSDPFAAYNAMGSNSDVIKAAKITNWATETDSECTWKVVTVTIKNISDKNIKKGYNVGAFITYTSPNGGIAWRFGDATGNKFKSYSLYDSAKKYIDDGIIVSGDGASGTYSYTANGVTYYSNTLMAYEIKDIVDVYIKGAVVTE